MCQAEDSVAEVTPLRELRSLGFDFTVPHLAPIVFTLSFEAKLDAFTVIFTEYLPALSFEPIEILDTATFALEVPTASGSSSSLPQEQTNSAHIAIRHVLKIFFLNSIVVNYLKSDYSITPLHAKPSYRILIEFPSVATPPPKMFVLK